MSCVGRIGGREDIALARLYHCDSIGASNTHWDLVPLQCFDLTLRSASSIYTPCARTCKEEDAEKAIRAPTASSRPLSTTSTR